MLTDEQKTIFAEEHLRCPNDTLMIIWRILGDAVCSVDPAAIISMADWLPNDPFVVAEKQRILLIPPSKEIQIIELRQAAKDAKAIGDYDAFHKIHRLIADMSGFIVRQSSIKSGKGDGDLDRLIEMTQDKPIAEYNG